MNRRQSPPLGMASLFTAFALLLLTVLALLSLSQAQADRRLSEKAAENTARCYQAQCQAEAIRARLQNGEMPPGVSLEDGQYRYGVPVSGVQTLEVALDAQSWEILRWQFTADPTPPEETLPVWAMNP